MVNGIRIEVVAFAAGLNAVEASWEIIVQAVMTLGLGKYSPVELQVAVEDWCRELTDRIEEEGAPSDREANAWVRSARASRA